MKTLRHYQGKYLAQPNNIHLLTHGASQSANATTEEEPMRPHCSEVVVRAFHHVSTQLEQLVGLTRLHGQGLLPFINHLHIHMCRGQNSLKWLYHPIPNNDLDIMNLINH